MKSPIRSVLLVSALFALPACDQIADNQLQAINDKVAADEDDAQAVERFAVRHGRTPSLCIVIPMRATDAELPTLEPLWADMQRRLIADAKSARPNEGTDDDRTEHCASE